MSYASCYTRINWLNKSESLTTPLGKTNLNKMDKAIKTIDDEMASISAEMVSMETSKVDYSQIKNMIVDFAYDDKTGVMTLTKYDGTSILVDTAIEKMAVNFTYDAKKQQLIVTLEDGSVQYVDLSALITQFEFDNTDTIAFMVGEDGQISASIRDGSITTAMLSSDVLATIITAESKAVAAANTAAQSANDAEIDAKMSQSYAVGESGIRDGEKYDNSKYYQSLAKSYCEDAQKLCSNQESTLNEINKKLSLAEFDVDETGNLIYTDNSAYDFIVNDNGELEWRVS